MENQYSQKDLENLEIVSGLVRRACVEVFGTPEQLAEQLSERRSGCSGRGYHRVSGEPEGEEDLMICYDCEAFFVKRDVELGSLPYRVESLD